MPKDNELSLTPAVMSDAGDRLLVATAASAVPESGELQLTPEARECAKVLRKTIQAFLQPTTKTKKLGAFQIEHPDNTPSPFEVPMNIAPMSGAGVSAEGVAMATAVGIIAAPDYWKCMGPNPNVTSKGRQ